LRTASFNLIIFYIVALLLKHYPIGAATKDPFWQAYPLHFCVHRDEDDVIDEDIIHMIVEAYPNAMLSLDGAGFLPIHRAGFHPVDQNFYHSP
jgi:hypothetical protein